MRWCTKPGCSGSMRGENLDVKKVTCPVCSTEVCFQCRDEWHGRKSCESNMNHKLEGFVQAHGGIRFCPVCKTKVERTEGCNHMTCIICGYDFCWLCLGYCGYDAHHFSMNSPYSCGASQFGGYNSRFCNYLQAIGLFLVAVIIAPIVYVGYFVIGGPILGAIMLNETCKTKRGICCCINGIIGSILGEILALVVGILLSPFALLIYCGAILFGIGYGLKVFF